MRFIVWITVWTHIRSGLPFANTRFLQCSFSIFAILKDQRTPFSSSLDSLGSSDSLGSLDSRIVHALHRLAKAPLWLKAQATGAHTLLEQNSTLVTLRPKMRLPEDAFVMHSRMLHFLSVHCPPVHSAWCSASTRIGTLQRSADWGPHQERRPSSAIFGLFTVRINKSARCAFCNSTSLSRNGVCLVDFDCCEIWREL